jgi:hypothetical protein
LRGFSEVAKAADKLGEAVLVEAEQVLPDENLRIGVCSCANANDVNGEDCCRFQVYWFERIAEGRIRAHLVYEVAAQNPVSCINAFLKAKIWEGKSFFDVEQEMRWINDEMDVE